MAAGRCPIRDVAAAVAAGRTSAAAIFGLQVTGPRHADRLLLEVAGAWEAAYPWPLSAPEYESFASVLD